jgi:hypothetical protein
MAAVFEATVMAAMSIKGMGEARAGLRHSRDL